MYYFYLGSLLLPVAPSKMTMKINGQNKTYTLLDGGEINVLKNPKLTDIEFEVMLPNVEYSFAVYEGGFERADYFLQKLKRLKKNRKKVMLKVIRKLPNGTRLFNTSLRVSVENYNVSESTDDGFDVRVSINLKQYRNYGTKTITLPAVTVTTEEPVVVETPREESESAPSNGLPTTYQVQKGDCLSLLAKQFYGNGSREYYMKIANANGISNPNLIQTGAVLTIPV